MSGVKRFPAVPCADILGCEDIDDIQLTDIEQCVAATDYDQLLAERDALLATTAKLREALVEAEDALASCYQVCDWPANGHTQQDLALATVRAALSLPTPSVQK